MADEVLKAKSIIHRIPYQALQQVYNRGIGAWKSNPESVRLMSGEKNYSSSRKGKMSKEQWAYARTAAFIDKKPSVYYGSDNDIREKYNLK
jgi:hypothetical protein